MIRTLSIRLIQCIDTGRQVQIEARVKQPLLILLHEMYLDQGVAIRWSFVFKIPLKQGSCRQGQNNKTATSAQQVR